MIGSKFSRHFFNQSEVKPKPIVAHACIFSRALCRLLVITSSFDWFAGLSQSFLIGQSNYFVLVLRHSIETRSIKLVIITEKKYTYSQSSESTSQVAMGVAILESLDMNPDRNV